MNGIRNIAIIAHVDHGKTTLVDNIIHQCQAVDSRKETGELILDNNDLERERGITILSKNVSANWKGVKINILDTPGHADFGGEVERVLKMVDGETHEPFEHLVIDVPSKVASKATELVMKRKGMLQVMEVKGDLQHLEFRIPSRGLTGLRNQVLTATAGEAVMTHRFNGYEPYAGELATRSLGSLVCMEAGQARAYEINRLQDRGTFFINPGQDIYIGQVIGECARENDMELNLVRGKKLTNIRASGADKGMRIAPARKLSLEEYMEWIADDEYLEVTPKALRVRKVK